MDTALPRGCQQRGGANNWGGREGEGREGREGPQGVAEREAACGVPIQNTPHGHRSVARQTKPARRPLHPGPHDPTRLRSRSGSPASSRRTGRTTARPTVPHAWPVAVHQPRRLGRPHPQGFTRLMAPESKSSRIVRSPRGPPEPADTRRATRSRRSSPPAPREPRRRRGRPTGPSANRFPARRRPGVALRDQPTELSAGAGPPPGPRHVHRAGGAARSVHDGDGEGAAGAQ